MSERTEEKLKRFMSLVEVAVVDREPLGEDGFEEAHGEWAVEGLASAVDEYWSLPEGDPASLSMAADIAGWLFILCDVEGLFD